jgi:endonuclease YncB( thermonuclease family)
MRILMTAAAVVALFTGTGLQAQSGASGLGHAKDGDSLMVGDTEVRLYGIDAPELHQTCQRAGYSWACGEKARAHLSALVDGRPVRCEQIGTDQYERLLGRCTVGSLDLNRAMVSLGYAVAYRHYSLDYASAEDTAKAYKRGLWAGTFEMPDEYRHAGRPQSAPRPTVTHSARTATRHTRPPQASSGCNIKGNRNRKGQWIYHLPGMPYYEQTRAEEIFCTEAQAQAAGYRRAIVR